MKAVRMSMLCQRRLLFLGQKKLKRHVLFLEAVRIGEPSSCVSLGESG